MAALVDAGRFPSTFDAYCPRENPRLCRGGCQSLTFPGVCSSPFGRASLASVQQHSLAPWSVAKRSLLGARNRKASGSAGGYLLDSPTVTDGRPVQKLK